jgi:hypothetical protein
MASPYRDVQLAMNYVASLDHVSDTITWSGNVSFANSAGSLSWDEDGSYTDATVDGFFSKLAKAVVKIVKQAATITTAFGLGGPEAAAVVAGVDFKKALLASALGLRLLLPESGEIPSGPK